MFPKITVLQFIIDGLNREYINQDTIQGIIYLLQAAGADLGYHFCWSSEIVSWQLQSDYSRLEYILHKYLDDKKLHSYIIGIIKKISYIFDKPAEFTGSQVKWIKVLSCYHFLRNVSELDCKQSASILIKKFNISLEQLSYATLALEGTIFDI